MQLLHGDCVEHIGGIQKDSVDLVVTSPPYDDLRTYNDSLHWSFDVFKDVALGLYPCVKPGGVVVWVVGDATKDGSETGTSFRQALYFKEVGFNIHDTMIWDKGTFTATGALAVRYAPVFEYMFVFSKGKPSVFNPIKDKVNKSAGTKIHGTVRQANGGTRPGSMNGGR